MTKEQLDALPHLISFPRSGSHWIHCTLELATNRRRVFRTEVGNAATDPITFLPADAPVEPAWVHAHSIRDRAAVSAPVAYLMRDPVDALFSLRETRDERRRKVDDEFVELALSRWATHVLRWTRSDERADAVFRYEDFVANPKQEFERIAAALALPLFVPGGLARATALMTKEKLIAHGKPKFVNFFGPALVSPKYSADREAFRAAFADRILKSPKVAALVERVG